MPHQCVRCNTFYDDGSNEILTGCKCGARLFFYVKKQFLEEAKEQNIKLDPKQKEELERDVLELVGTNKRDDEPVILDFESIRVLSPGKFELDLVHLFKKDPVIYKLADGKYIIDLPKTFKK